MQEQYLLMKEEVETARIKAEQEKTQSAQLEWMRAKDDRDRVQQWWIDSKRDLDRKAHDLKSTYDTVRDQDETEKNKLHQQLQKVTGELRVAKQEIETMKESSPGNVTRPGAARGAPSGSIQMPKDGGKSSKDAQQVKVAGGTQQNPRGNPFSFGAQPRTPAPRVSIAKAKKTQRMPKT